MKRAPEGDDARSSRHSTSQLERRFDCLGARVAKEDGVERVGTGVREQARKPADRFYIAQRVADVEQLVGLVFDCCGDGRVMVTQRCRGYAAGKVQEAATFRVVQGVTLAVAPAAFVVAAEDWGEAGFGDGRVVAGGRERVDLRRGQAACRGADRGHGGGCGDDLFL